MTCPKCKGAMEAVRTAEMEVDRCVGCQGVWFDLLEAEDLKKLRAAGKVDVGSARKGKARDSQRHVDCPKCSVRMLLMVALGQPHIHYESCPICFGIFFDAGELKDYESETPLDVLKSLLAVVRTKVRRKSRKG